VAKRTGQGRTKKEIIRSLKRYITRQIYRILNAATEVGNIELKPVVAPT
jgi:transposase